MYVLYIVYCTLYIIITYGWLTDTLYIPYIHCMYVCTVHTVNVPCPPSKLPDACCCCCCVFSCLLLLISVFINCLSFPWSFVTIVDLKYPSISTYYLLSINWLMCIWSILWYEDETSLGQSHANITCTSTQAMFPPNLHTGSIIVYALLLTELLLVAPISNRRTS